MVRKGFTIVEMAMVLVVIGLLVVLSVRGKTIFETAKMRMEVAKLNKFEVALQTHFTRTATLPENLGGGRLNLEILVNKGFLVKTDLTDRLHNKDWDFRLCSEPSYGGDYFVTDELSKKVCAVGSDGNLQTRFVCYIEKNRDDQDVTAGRGRGWGAAISRPNSSDYKDCDVLTGETGYAYRIF